MRRGYLICLFQCLIATLALSQIIAVPRMQRALDDARPRQRMTVSQQEQGRPSWLPLGIPFMPRVRAMAASRAGFVKAHLSDGFLKNLENPSILSSPIFLSASSYDSGGSGDSVVVADVNGDGKPDMIVVNELTSNGSGATGAVGILLGNGDGTALFNRRTVARLK